MASFSAAAAAAPPVRGAAAAAAAAAPVRGAPAPSASGRRKRSASEAALGHPGEGDDGLDPRLEANLARYAGRPRKSVLIGRRSKNARPSDADLDLSFDDAPAASPPEPPGARAAAGPWVDLTEDDDLPATAASVPQPARARAAVELLSSGSDDDTPLSEVGTRERGGRRRELSWMAPRREEAGAIRAVRADVTRRHRGRDDFRNRRDGRARSAAAGGESSAAAASVQPDMDADARLARQLQQQEDEQARRVYQQHHRQQWQLERQRLRAEVEDLQDDEEHYQQRQGFAESWAARMAGVAAQLGLGDNFRNLFQRPGDAWHPAGHNASQGGGRRRGAAAASLQHRELTSADYEELSQLDQGSAGASKELINSLIKTKLKNDHADDCCICMDKMKQNTLVRILPCTHTFHTRCADKWLKQKNSCPMCQRPIDAPE